MKKTLTAIGVVLALATGTYTSTAQDCPICPGGTNGPGGSYTNPPSPPQEFPTNALLLRQATIYAESNLVLTNYGWTLDTNNLLIGAGQTAFDSVTAGQFGTLTYHVGVLNTSSNRLYVVQHATSVLGSYSDATLPFIGTDGSEYIATIAIVNDGGNGFWRVKQLDGFLAYSVAAKKAQGMGQFFGCPSAYVGFIDFTNGPVGGQYRIDTNVNFHTVTDFLRPTNHIQLFGDGHLDCDIGSATLTNNNAHTAFTCWASTYFYPSYPSNQLYVVRLQGFLGP